MGTDPEAADRARRGSTARPLVGLVLVLVWPAVNAAAGIGGVLLGLPEPIKAVSGLVLPAGIALMWRAPASATARRWLAAALLLAVAAAALLALMPAADAPAPAGSAPQTAGEARPVAAIGMLLQGGAVAVFGWGLRRWLRQAGQNTAATWWTVYPASAVASTVALATSLAITGPAQPSPAGGVTQQFIITSVAGLLGSVNLLIHIGACITGILAFRRMR